MNKPKPKPAVKKPADRKAPSKPLKINADFEKALKILATPRKKKK